MTVMNIFLLIIVVVVTGVTLYQTACFLAADITGVEREAQLSFNSSLLTYAWIIGLLVVGFGAILYSMVTRKILVPIKELTSAMESMKTGQYPGPLTVDSDDEIGDLVEHFNRLNQRLQKQEQSRHQMLRDLSHELRTPLSNLHGYLEALEKGVLEGNQEIYRSLSEETDRVTQMLGQLDAVEAWGDTPLERTLPRSEEDIKEVAMQVIQLFAVEFEHEHIDLDFEVEPQLLNVNKEGIQQVLTNLLKNALIYHLGEGPVRVSGQKEKGWYLLKVSGKGQAIPDDKQELIFERFYRVDPSRSKGGSGLGLSISKQIVQRHNGLIGLDSDGDVHSFYIRLPLEA